MDAKSKDSKKQSYSKESEQAQQNMPKDKNIDKVKKSSRWEEK